MRDRFLSQDLTDHDHDAFILNFKRPRQLDRCMRSSRALNFGRPAIYLELVTCSLMSSKMAMSSVCCI